MFYEFFSYMAALTEHDRQKRLGHRPFSIFRRAKGGWAFWTAT